MKSVSKQDAVSNVLATCALPRTTVFQLTQILFHSLGQTHLPDRGTVPHPFPFTLAAV